MAAFKHILVALDFEESSKDAVELGVELAHEFDASLALLHAYEVPVYGYPDMTFWSEDLMKSVENAARRELDRALATVQARVPGATAVLRTGAPAAQILDAIQEIRPDLVVVGTHGRRGLSRTLLGSVAERVVRLSPVPVLVARRPSAAAA